MKAGNPLGGLPAFYCTHFFSRRNPSLPYGCTATKRIFDDSAHFYLFRNAKKAQTEKAHLSLKFSPALNKVFEHLFQKVPRSRARRHCRAPRSAKAPIGVFFFVAFSFAPALPKEKADGEFAFSFVC